MKILDLKIVLRNLYRNKLYTLLNMLGLSIGITSAMLIFLWVQFQISFDRFHTHGDNIYRVIQDQFYTNGEVFHVQVTPPGMSDALKGTIANITHTTRYYEENVLVKAGDTKAMERIQMVDNDFFNMFSFPLKQGDPGKILENIHSIAISEKMAAKYFGEKDPVGEIMLLDDTYPFTVTGVIQDNPLNTEIHCDIMIPFTFMKEAGTNIDDMNSNWITTYVQLASGTLPDSVNSMIERYKKIHFPETKTVFYLQPLRNIHLYWIWGGGPIKNVRLFSIIAALIILIAAINFTNLSTAMAARRFKEIGIKKSFGASRGVLIRQFFTETLILSALSLFIALIFAESFLPWYNSLLRTELRIDYSDWKMMGAFVGIMIVTGLLSGAYPALFLSSFKPVNVLKQTHFSHKRSLLREVLVVLQFGLAIVLIVNTIIIKKQQDFMQKMETGIHRENILCIPARGELRKKYELFKTQLLDHPEIISVSASVHLPTGIWSNSGGYKWQGKAPEVDPLVSNTRVDFDYAKTFGIKMHEGEFYPDRMYNDTNNIVINKTFADIIGKDPVLGEVLEIWGMKLTVIGITEDFHFKPMFSKIEPLAMFCLQRDPEYVFCKVKTAEMQKTIKMIGEIHNSINSSFPFEYRFLDEEYGNLYENEKKQGHIFNLFAFLAIFISCLGLFGLSSFMMTQRTKEIGIRKAHGASIVNIMSLFNRYYTRWVIVSFVVAIPVSYYFVHAWLKNYAFKTSISWWIFALAGIITFLIAVFTVSWQSWRSAKKNPVEALRYE